METEYGESACSQSELTKLAFQLFALNYKGPGITIFEVAKQLLESDYRYSNIRPFSTTATLGTSLRSASPN